MTGGAKLVSSAWNAPAPFLFFAKEKGGGIFRYHRPIHNTQF
jgi:hypothetical protein